MKSDITKIEAKIREFDELLEPYANAPVDINDDDWQEKLRSVPNPLDELGISSEVRALMLELVLIYKDSASKDRAKIRYFLKKYDSFGCYASLGGELDTREDFVNNLILCSVFGDSMDSRDVISHLRNLVAKAKKKGINLKSEIGAVAKMSSSKDVHGMGSVKNFLLSLL